MKRITAKKAIFKAFKGNFNKKTAATLARLTGRSLNDIRPNLCQLRDMGLVENHMPFTLNGRQVKTWALTRAGRALIINSNAIKNLLA